MRSGPRLLQYKLHMRYVFGFMPTIKKRIQPMLKIYSFTIFFSVFIALALQLDLLKFAYCRITRLEALFGVFQEQRATFRIFVPVIESCSVAAHANDFIFMAKNHTKAD